MIGHYLLTLDDAAETRVLTDKMHPGSYLNLEEGARCLVGVICNAALGMGATALITNRLFPSRHDFTRPLRISVENIYDDACKRFGTERVNAAIRNRILSNQARRTVRQREAVTA